MIQFFVVVECMVFSLNKVESSCRVSCETLFLALRRIKVDSMKLIHSVGKLIYNNRWKSRKNIHPVWSFLLLEASHA